MRDGAIAKARRDRGSATAYTVIAAAALVVIALVITEIAGLVAVRHRAIAAADLSALSASQASIAGEDSCSAARATAQRNGARVVSCRMDYDVATVIARTTSHRWWGWRWAAEGRARAAPDFYLDP